MIEKMNCDILIIGGGPAGSVAALTAKVNYPNKKVLIVREFEFQLVPCAIPYVFSDVLGSTNNNIASCQITEDKGVEILISKVNDINIDNKIAYTEKYEISYDKLVFATGSEPFVHSSLEHSLTFEGVFTVPKNKVLIDKMKKYSIGKRDIIVIGTGFIGVELAMEFAKNYNVTIVGGSQYILKTSFDDEIALEAEEILVNSGIKVIGNDKVVEIIDQNGDNIVNTVKLESGITIDTDMVVLATGYKANTALASKVGISFGYYGGIWVDEYMRTSNHDIFAVGDCCARRDFITKEPSKIMLASTSSAEGRIAGSSLFGIEYLRNFSGTIAIFSTKIGDIAFSSAGLTEEQAKEANIDIVVGSFSGVNRHPKTIPNSQRQFVKLIAMKNGGQIIGGQIVGGDETGEMINLIGFIIETKLDIYHVMSMQIATQPLLTSAPIAYPIISAASSIAQKI